MKWLMSQGRRRDTQTPRTSVLAHDFTRLGFNMVDELKAAGTAPESAIRLLDVAVDFRNAIVHGNETQLARIAAAGQIKATMTPIADTAEPSPVWPYHGPSDGDHARRPP